ncbi:hypothetical protein LINPERHAP2_LOCUS39334 [Linum perenne]
MRLDPAKTPRAAAVRFFLAPSLSSSATVAERRQSPRICWHCRVTPTSTAAVRWLESKTPPSVDPSLRHRFTAADPSLRRRRLSSRTAILRPPSPSPDWARRRGYLKNRASWDDE